MREAVISTRVAVDNFGRPFESPEAEELFKLREKDPVQSLNWSQGDYIKAVKALDDLIHEHSNTLYQNAIEFVEELQNLTEIVEQALRQVQFDIQRVAEHNNKGWYEVDV